MTVFTTIKTAAGIGAMMLLPQTAVAQDSLPELDLYFSGAIGASVAGDYEAELDQNISPLPIWGDFDTSGALRLAVGSTFGSSFRGEAELSYRDMQFADEFVSVAGPIDSVGNAAITALMVNGLYTMPIGSSDYVGYFGGGLGVAQVDVDLKRGPNLPNFVVSQGDYTSLAAQLRVGAERQLNNGVTVFTDYTYFHVANKDYTTFNTARGARALRSPSDPSTATRLPWVCASAADFTRAAPLTALLTIHHCTATSYGPTQRRERARGRCGAQPIQRTRPTLVSAPCIRTDTDIPL
jgi:opacity protein-like surface antigen